MPQYSILQDRPWVEAPGRKPLAPSASVYSEDDYQSAIRDFVMPEVPPRKVRKQNQQHQHSSSQHSTDNGPQVRQARLPIFKQVRSLLHKPSKLDMSRIGRPRESSQGGQTEVSDPSRKDSRDAYEIRKHWPEQGSASSKDTSPVSALRDSDLEQSIPPGSGWKTVDDEWLPASDVADFAYRRQGGPTQISAATRVKTSPETPCPTARLIDIKRKPAARTVCPGENVLGTQVQSPSPPPSRDTHYGSVIEITRADRDAPSRFSWTTYGESETPGLGSFDLASRPSMDRPLTGRSMDAEAPRSGQHSSRLAEDMSRFSWSTINTAMPSSQTRPDSPPPSPLAAVPTKYKNPPVQSILSRHRPIQRQDREEWNPQPRRVCSATPVLPSDALPAVISKLNMITGGHQRSATDEAPGSSKKSLPLPPDMVSPVSPMSHLELLLGREQDLILQRTNIEKAIVENAKIENASPMDVTFAEVRAAKKELEMLRVRSEEICLEERQIGISIARARRKEGYGEEEGLWVRRVTG